MSAISTGRSKSHVTHIKTLIYGCNSVQFDWINNHTTSLWLYKSPRRSRHVVTCSRQSVSCLSTVEVQGCLFHKCDEWFAHFIRGGTDILDKVFFSDEAWFQQSGYVNIQNRSIWSAENPHTFHERPLNSLKVGEWCAVSRRRIIGPTFFSETTRAEHYQELIMNFTSLLEVGEQDCWFQQDGATGLRRIQKIQQCRC
jgi:hypothetical protein